MAERDELLDHNYDGIQEYDNDLPKWWIWLFIITLIYGGAYVFYRHVSPGQDQIELLAMEMKEHQELREEVESSKPADTVSEESLLALTTNTEALAKGGEIFAAKCSVCHKAQGQGLVGPNLTDDYWLHGGKITEIHSTVVNGVVEKGMQAWKGFLSDEEINEVVAYVWTLHGTNPPDAKKPEGELVPRAES